jgi:hypothetical protein
MVKFRERDNRILSRQIVIPSRRLIHTEPTVALQISQAIMDDNVFTTGQLYDAARPYITDIQLTETTKRNMFADMSYQNLMDMVATCIQDNMFNETEKNRLAAINLLSNMMTNRGLEDSCELIQVYANKTRHDILNNDRNVSNNVRQMLSGMDPSTRMNIFDGISTTVVSDYCENNDKIMNDAETARLILFRRLEYLRQKKTQLHLKCKKRVYTVYISQFVNIRSVKLVTNDAKRKWVFRAVGPGLSHQTAKVVIPDDVECYYSVLEFLPESVSTLVIGYVI